VKPLVVLAVMAALIAPLASGSRGSSPDITTLVKQATAKLHKQRQFRRAVLLEADGTPRRGRVTSAAGITRWRIVFQNQTTRHSRYASAFIRAVNGKLGRVVGVRSPFLEDRNIRVVPKMTLANAVAKLRAAGHRRGFENVTLRYPLGPGFHEPLYIFGFGSGRYWSVGTRTGKVKRIS
jgi:hypothetical protein